MNGSHLLLLLLNVHFHAMHKVSHPRYHYFPVSYGWQDPGMWYFMQDEKIGHLFQFTEYFLENSLQTSPMGL